MDEKFRLFANKMASIMGTPWAFASSLSAVIVWALMGPAQGYSDTWQLVINTGTTIVTFLMVFLIQNTQNRDARAIHLKLDELIRATTKARNSLINLESLTNQELDEIHSELCLAQKVTAEKLSQIEKTRERKQKQSQ